MKFRIPIVIGAICAGAVLIGSAFWLGVIAASEDRQDTIFNIAIFQKEEAVPVFSSGERGLEFYDSAYDRAGSLGAVGSQSAVVAHHLLVADKIAEVFMAIGSDKVDTVIILSPNHFDLGVSPAQTSSGAWGTPYGVVEADSHIVDDLVGSVDSLKIEDITFEYEHGVAVLTPYVARSFPNAKIVPLALHDSLTDDEVREIANAIADAAPNAVVIASIDMSHSLPQAAADFHDSVTMRTIEAGGACDSCSLDLEIDANAVLDVLFAVNEAREDQVWNLTHHGSSLAMGATNDWEENTSHILGYFTQGDPAGEEFVAVHIVGDIMLDRGVRKLIDAAGDFGYPWEEMDRYLSGAHLTVGNLEGAVNNQQSTYTYDPPFRFVFSPESVEETGRYIDLVNLANNHASDVGSAGLIETKERLTEMGIDWFGSYASPIPRIDKNVNGIPLTLIGYHQFQPDTDALINEIESAKQEGRFVIVLPHWGTEYINSPTQSQRTLAQTMIDAGADLIIGGHPHVPQGVEVINNVPVVYSLGNFVFDQFIPETWTAITAGIIISDTEIEIHLIPVYTKDGQPTPISDTDAQDLFEMLSDVSGDDIQNQILTGKLTTQYE
ncbi:MAG: AmmeMemoRadiSam system protein B [bacterium]